VSCVEQRRPGPRLAVGAAQKIGPALDAGPMSGEETPSKEPQELDGLSPDLEYVAGYFVNLDEFPLYRATGEGARVPGTAASAFGSRTAVRRSVRKTPCSDSEIGGTRKTSTKIRTAGVSSN